MKTCFCSFWWISFNYLLHGTAHAYSVYASWSSHIRKNEWRPTASTLCPLAQSSPQKVQAVSPSYVQNKPQMDHPQIIFWLLVAISNATHIALWCSAGRERRKRRNRRWTVLIFNRFRFATWKYLIHIAIYYCRLRQARSISCFMYF